MATHSDDGGPGADARLLLTSAMDHAAGSQRPIFWDQEDYPHAPAPVSLLAPSGYVVWLLLFGSWS